MEISKKDIDFLVSILKKYIDTSLATITNRGRIKVHHFEEQYMRTVNGGLPLDQSLFRTYLQTCGKVNVWIDSDKTGELPTDGDQDVLYFLWVDGSYVMYIYTDTYVLITTTTQIDDLNVSGATTYSSQKIVSLIVTTCLGMSYSNLISGLQSTNAQGAIDELKFLIDTIKQTGSVSLGAPLYQSNEDSDVLGYKKIKYTPDALETILPPITLTSTEQLIRTYLFDLPINTTTISAGNWIGSVIGKISNAAGTSKLRVEAFFRHINGNETTLFSKESADINNTDFDVISMDFAGDVYSCLTTDRLGFRVYGVTSGANRTLTTKIGDGNLSFFSTPLSIRHDQTRDKNGNPDFLHINEEQKALITSTAGIVSAHTEDISDLYSTKANKSTTLGGYGITDVPSDDKTYGRLNGDWSEIDTSGGGISIIPITWSALKALCDVGTLVPGQIYRITDYTTTTVQADTQSAGHDFDVIVTALSTNELSEDAKCVRKAGDTYFTNANLEAWEIKYCIDNDTSRFAWADEVNGKGVIYYMKDEWGNECPYDFKNIQFIRKLTDGYLDEDSGVSIYVYTFTWFDENNEVNDLSLIGNELTNDEGYKSGIFNNTIKETTAYSVFFERNTPLFVLGDNVFLSHHSFNEGFFDGCFNNSFGVNCYSNTFGDSCYSNTFGNNCGSNTFGNNCGSNTFGNSCYSNTFGNSCYSNTFGNQCSSNTFGNNFECNNFGNSCYSNTFGDECYSNTFGDSCSSNTFGKYFRYNTFGNSCYSNNFYHGLSGTTKKDFIRYIVLEDGCSYNNFYSTLTTSSASYLQRIRIKGLEDTTLTNIQITLSETNTEYEWVIAKNSSGIIEQYCPEDHLMNNQTYKIEDTSVSTWSSSTAYAGYAFQAQINIDDLTESDIVSVTFAGVDVISGNYYPTIEIYEGYILVFAKVNTTITIPTIVIHKIDL